MIFVFLSVAKKTSSSLSSIPGTHDLGDLFGVAAEQQQFDFLRHSHPKIAGVPVYAEYFNLQGSIPQRTQTDHSCLS
jgi:hypothetical protein